MRRCPTCQHEYADDTLSFCLEDGTVLLNLGDVSSRDSDPNATLFGGPPSHRSNEVTEVLADHSVQTGRVPQSEPTLVVQEPRITARDVYGTPPPPTKTPNTSLVVGLTVIATLILIALGGIGAWFLFKGDKTAGPTQSQLNQNQNASSPTVNDNAGVPNANSSTSPAASPTASPVNVTAEREQVTAVLNGWTSASRAHDIDRHMSYYADTLETYYNASNVSASRVRADRARAYALYATIDIELGDIKVTIDPSGDSATAVFDKTWTFEGSEKYSSGSVHQKIWLVKAGGRWRITGEKDLQVYYVNRER